MKLGNHRIVVRSKVQTGETNDYGQDIVRNVDKLVRWCSVTPTRSREEDDRSIPSVAGCTVLAPARAKTIEDADVILYPVTETQGADGKPVYSGREWGVVGDVGQWDEYTEFQIRRTS